MSYFKEPEIKDIIKQALREDIGKKDITTDSIIPRNKFVKANLIAKQDCVICGLAVTSLVFKLQDRNIRSKSLVSEGDFVKKGEIIAQIKGPARSILTAERVALNFLSLLSGISTKTRKFVEVVKPYKVKIMDTRKTIPGLRELQKYAVRIGGGYNHRMSLDEMVLIKDNHIRVIGGYRGLQKKHLRKVNVEIEVKNLREFKEALKLKPDIIMLDNMDIKDIKKAVQIRNYQLPLTCSGRQGITNYQLPKLEASGGISLKNVEKVASAGVDMISIGALTHSVNSVDISLEIM